MVGYPIILEILSRVFPHKKINKKKDYKPKVSIIVPAHNEELVIENKIKNLLSIQYPSDLLEIIITSDYSTDKTNEIVKDYISKYPCKIILHETRMRKGKTNAQDEAVQVATGDILVLTDANSLFKKNALLELVEVLSDPKIGYVTGKLSYLNSKEDDASELENSYWNIDLHMRLRESNLASITAGNGSIYAVRKSDYVSIDPIYSHDSIFPILSLLNGKRAVYAEKAVAYEKAGETFEDEFKRKVRMSRKIIATNFIYPQKYNFLKYGLFSFFYVSHRTFRNNLYMFHLLLLISNILIVLTSNSIFFIVTFLIQLSVYLISFSRVSINNKIIRFISYYIMTIFAQLVGAVREISGKSRPFWEKAETTR